MAAFSHSGGAILDDGMLWQQRAEEAVWQAQEQEISDRVAMLENLIRRTNDLPARDLAYGRDQAQARQMREEAESRRGPQTFAAHGWVGPFYSDGRAHQIAEFPRVGAVVPGVSLGNAVQGQYARAMPLQAVEHDFFFDPAKAERQALKDREQKARVLAYRYDHPGLMSLAGLNRQEVRPRVIPGDAFDLGPPWRHAGGAHGSTYFAPLDAGP
mmetsp:Transcript_73125/g.136687  ORF Transcript_73125/g.136687 Transcript_73125/m.136687 type:complete len:213 (+) Transcript_73125:71-709(+)